MCDPEHIVFISMEPPDWGCPRSFYHQFSHLVTCDRNTGHKNVIFKNCISWWVGLKVEFNEGHQISTVFSHDYDSLKLLHPPNKENKISIITSGNKHFPGHEKRLRFLDKLSSCEISKYVDVFGGYRNPIEDKMDALLNYKYHLALENSVVTDYWTEKFADPLLAWCLPIYYGCPNIGDYFPAESLVPVNIESFDETVRGLWSILESNCYSQRLSSIEKARNMVLDDYNIFQIIRGICARPAESYRECRIKPLSSFALRDERFDRKIFRKSNSLVRNFLARLNE